MIEIDSHILREKGSEGGAVDIVVFNLEMASDDLEDFHDEPIHVLHHRFFSSGLGTGTVEKLKKAAPDDVRVQNDGQLLVGPPCRCICTYLKVLIYDLCIVLYHNLPILNFLKSSKYLSPFVGELDETLALALLGLTIGVLGFGDEVIVGGDILLEQWPEQIF